MAITTESVRPGANQPAGLFYGVQTLRQLLPVMVEYEAARRPQQADFTAGGANRGLSPGSNGAAPCSMSRGIFSRSKSQALH